MYEYIRSEPEVFTVGYHDANGKWVPVGDYDSRFAASVEVERLNGGAEVVELKAENAKLKKQIDWLVGTLSNSSGYTHEYIRDLIK